MRHPNQQGFLARGGLWVAAQFVVMGGIAGAGVGWPGDWGAEWWNLVGAALLACAACIGWLGFRQLGRSLTPYPKPLPGSELVTSGIYGLVRHPLYACVLLASLGWAVLRQSVIALVAVVALGVLLDAKSRREERWLCARYPEYAEYRRRVRRLVPWVY